MKIIFKLSIITFFLLGIFFRIWRLQNVPIELFGDEIDVGLQAYSILTTNKDYFGNKFPLMFHSFSEYRLPMQLYLDVPFIKIFGLKEIGVRAPAVLMGFVSLVLFYYLVKMSLNKKVALIASLFLLFSPWHFNFSRQANDAGILLPFILGGTLFFIKGMKNYKYLFLSATLFALSVYSYAIATVFTPLFVSALIIIYRKEVFNYSLIKIMFVVGVGLLILFPFLKFTLSGLTSQRFSSISVTSGDSIFQEVVDKRRWSESFLTRIFYNTKAITLDRIGKNYLMSFSTTFLLSNGDPNLRQGIEGFGQMYVFEIIFVFIGITSALFLDFKSNKKIYLAFFLWLILSPIPSSLTIDGGSHASRLILMLPPLTFFSAIGFKQLLDNLLVKKEIFYKLILAGILFFMLFNFTKFMHRYFIIWPNESWRFWQYGYKESISFVKEMDPNYKKIYFNNTYEPILGRFLFWYGYDMKLFQEQFTGDVHIDQIADGFNGFKLGEKYYFGELVKPIEGLAKPDTLVVASAEKDATNPFIFERHDLRLLKTINAPAGETIFYIFSGRDI